jgi:hypothetical protein
MRSKGLDHQFFKSVDSDTRPRLTTHRHFDVEHRDVGAPLARLVVPARDLRHAIVLGHLSRGGASEIWFGWFCLGVRRVATLFYILVLFYCM